MTRSWSFTGPFLLAVLLIFDSRASADEKAGPLVIGETFTIDSKVLNEKRRINIYMPPGYADWPTA